MEGSLLNLALATATNTLVVGLAVLIHYEALVRLASLLPGRHGRHRRRVLLGVFGCLGAHVVEIWLFALAYYLYMHGLAWGELGGNSSGSLLDCVYYSFTCFTTLGFGDIAPHGQLRYLSGIEALTGLVLITWSASFLFLLMQRSWRED